MSNDDLHKHGYDGQGVADDMMSRRRFLQGLGVAGSGVLAAAALSGCGADEGGSSQGDGASTAYAVEPITWDKETEVLVCGYGAAGAAAAIEAAENGAEVLIIEKAALPGGSMARCGGAIMGGGTRVQQELGVEDSSDSLFEWVKTCTAGMCPDDIIRTYADNAGKNVDWLQDLGDQYCDKPLFDVALAIENDQADAEGRSNGVVGGCLDATGAEYEKFGITKAQAVPRSHWAHAEPDVTANSGPELFDPLFNCISANSSISTEYDTALYKLIRDDAKRVIGVEAKQGGKSIFIKASKGVMLATGGFPNSQEMQKKFVHAALDFVTYMCMDCTGDGIRAAMDIGADLYNMDNYYPVNVPQVYHFNVQYNDVYNSWDMDEDGWMYLPDNNMAEMHGGVVINTKAQVLDVWGEVIPGLYASGCDTGTNIFGIPGNYPGCGCYVSFSIVYGRIAGAEMATQ
jgi:3-oxo-5alpha-steroid 4-dehydrogenase